MIVDAEGRLWYMGSHNGRLGVLECEARGSLSMGWRGGVYGVILSWLATGHGSGAGTPHL